MNRSVLGLPVVLAATVLGACTSNSASSGDGTIGVTSTDDDCEITSVEAPSGNVVFEVVNDGSQVTEFYLLGDDGLRIVGEVENIGPGLTRNLIVQASPGEYFTACKPGMTGEGIRSAFTVTDSGEDPVRDTDVAELLTVASDQYRLYVRDQAAQLVTATERFAELIEAGDDDAARALYAAARVHWERIEPVAESFGDLDPRLDLREADLEPGQEWTGWHRLEKELWPPAEYAALTAAERSTLADQLVADTVDLETRVQDLTYDPTQLGNGAKELLDEVATGKVTGEEETWSHTDLWDFQANVDGARVAFEALEPVLRKQDDALADTLTARFASLQVLLDGYRDGEGFVLYTDLDAAEVKTLADAVNALAEPLSQLTAAVVA